jgi:hypothetical protein
MREKPMEYSLFEEVVRAREKEQWAKTQDYKAQSTRRARRSILNIRSKLTRETTVATLVQNEYISAFLTG